MQNRARLVPAVLAVMVLLAGCGADEPVATEPSAAPLAAEPSAEPTPTETETPAAPPETPSPPPSPAPVPVAPRPPAAALEGVAVAAVPWVQVSDLTNLAWRPGDPGIYLTTQGGTVRRVVDGQLQPEPVIDLTAEVTELLPGSERGLLGIDFDPRDGRMFLFYTDRANSDSHLVSFEVGPDGRALPETRREVLFEPQPGLGHKGGHLVFDPSGTLFVALGDGGGSNGRDAQDMSKILGSVIRIVPRLDGPGYDVPPDNPYVGQPGIRPEIWHKGLRNPWRFSIDEGTGDMWISDVGNEAVEEINLVPPGQRGLNFGWYFYEGTNERVNGAPAGVTPPVHEYPHSIGPAVIGGHVYRGSAIPGLAGAFVFADIGGIFWGLGSDGATRLPITVDGAVTAIEEGPDGELYVLTLAEGAYRLVPA